MGAILRTTAAAITRKGTEFSLAGKLIWGEEEKQGVSCPWGTNRNIKAGTGGAGSDMPLLVIFSKGRAPGERKK